MITQEHIDKGAEAAVKVQNTAAQVGRVTGIVVGGVVSTGIVGAFQLFRGTLKGALQGAKVGMGHAITAGEDIVAEVKSELANKA